MRIILENAGLGRIAAEVPLVAGMIAAMTDLHPDPPNAHDRADPPRTAPLWRWIVEGLRASVLLAPRIAALAHALAADAHRADPSLR